MQKKKVIIFLYNRLFDPVIQSNFWLYIHDTLSTPHNLIEFHLISFEDKNHPLTEEQEEKVENWQNQGLKWTRLNWHSGLSPMAKILDLINGGLHILKLRMKGTSRIISVASISGSLVYLYSLLIPLKRYVYCYEPHSEYAADNNIWEKSSLPFKVLNFLEKKCVKNAFLVSSGTVFMKERIFDEWGFSKPKFIQIPTVVDDGKFMPNESNRSEVRKELGIDDHCRLLFYPGKFGDLYYKEEIVLMYKWLRETLENLHFLVVSPNDPNMIHDLFAKHGITPEHYSLRQANYENIDRYFAAADFGIVAVAPGPSKKFVSNIKVGEYLCSGLPYLITEGVSEDYLYATSKSVGTVVKRFDEEEIKNAASSINDFLKMDRAERTAHCRKVGMDYRGLSVLKLKFKDALNQLLA